MFLVVEVVAANIWNGFLFRDENFLCSPGSQLVLHVKGLIKVKGRVSCVVLASQYWEQKVLSTRVRTVDILLRS